MSLQPKLKQQQAGSKNNKAGGWAWGGVGWGGLDAVAGTTAKCAAAH